MSPTPREVLIAEAARFHARGWMPATSGNLSVRSGPTAPITITRSGVDKGFLQESDMIVLDANGEPTDIPPSMRPSAETAIHLAIYRRIPSAGAVFHVHTVASTLASMQASAEGCPPELEFQGHELIKGYGIWEANAIARLPVFANHADVSQIAQDVEAFLATPPTVPAFLTRGHGITAWGETAATARRHLEVTEFLCQCQSAAR